MFLYILFFIYNIKLECKNELNDFNIIIRKLNCQLRNAYLVIIVINNFLK